MTDRPILFSGPMVRAILEGRKTQTRRILALRGHKSFSHFGRSDTPGYVWHFRDAEQRWHDLSDGGLRNLLPFTVSDRLWVREAFRGGKGYDACPHAAQTWWPVNYEADGAPADADMEIAGKLRPSIHMPRWASRLTLTVTDIRVQRLQDISERDALAEGIRYENVIVDTNCYGGAHTEETADRYWNGTEPDDFEGHEYAADAFADLWDGLNAKRGFGWDANPWVCALTFTTHRKNTDMMEKSD